MHPDIYRDLARHHHADLDREAAHASLAATIRERDNARRPATLAARLGAALRVLRLAILIHAERALVAIESRVASALAKAVDETA